MMALLWVEGFEGYGTSTGVDMVNLDDKYMLSNPTVMDNTTGRIAGFAVNIVLGGHTLRTPNLGTLTTVIVGFAYKTGIINSGVFPNADILRFLNVDGDEQLALFVETSGELKILRGGIVLATSGTGGNEPSGLLPFHWTYIEVKILFDQTVGTAEVRVNQRVVIDETGLDTKNQVSGDCNFVQLVGTNARNSFDDWYICDDSGAVNNDFLGVRKVRHQFPDGDNGTPDWTPDTGSTNYTQVDEDPHDDDTSYVESGTLTDLDLYDYGAIDLDTDSDIAGLMVTTICKETDANPFDLITSIKSVATQDDDAGQSIGSTDYVARVRISEQDPDAAAAWAKSTIDAAQFGITVG